MNNCCICLRSVPMTSLTINLIHLYIYISTCSFYTVYFHYFASTNTCHHEWPSLSNYSVVERTYVYVSRCAYMQIPICIHEPLYYFYVLKYRHKVETSGTVYIRFYFICINIYMYIRTCTYMYVSQFICKKFSKYTSISWYFIIDSYIKLLSGAPVSKSNTYHILHCFILKVGSLSCHCLSCGNRFKKILYADRNTNGTHILTLL